MSLSVSATEQNALGFTPHATALCTSTGMLDMECAQFPCCPRRLQLREEGWCTQPLRSHGGAWSLRPGSATAPYPLPHGCRPGPGAALSVSSAESQVWDSARSQSFVTLISLTSGSFSLWPVIHNSKPPGDYTISSRK